MPKRGAATFEMKRVLFHARVSSRHRSFRKRDMPVQGESMRRGFERNELS